MYNRPKRVTMKGMCDCFSGMWSFIFVMLELLLQLRQTRADTLMMKTVLNMSHRLVSPVQLWCTTAVSSLILH